MSRTNPDGARTGYMGARASAMVTDSVVLTLMFIKTIQLRGLMNITLGFSTAPTLTSIIFCDGRPCPQVEGILS